MKLMDETEYLPNMLSEDDVFSFEEERNLFYKHDAIETEKETPEENEKILLQGYDIQLTFADKSIKVLHAFPFEDIKEGEIFAESDVVYIQYTSVTTGAQVSTKEAELATKQAEELAQQVIVPDEPVQGTEECYGDDILTW